MVTKKKDDTRTAHFKLFSVGLWKHPCERCTTLFEEGGAEGIKKKQCKARKQERLSCKVIRHRMQKQLSLL